MWINLSPSNHWIIFSDSPTEPFPDNSVHIRSLTTHVMEASDADLVR